MTTQIVFVTIGESPRADLQAIYDDYFKGSDEVSQVGLLDGVSHQEADERFSVDDPDEAQLTSRFVDGYQVIMSQSKVERQLQLMINQLEAAKVEVIALLCTGNFEHLTAHHSTLITAEEVTIPYIKTHYPTQLVGIVNPLAKQIEDSKRKWELTDDQAVFTYASPYQVQVEEFDRAGEFLAEAGVKAVVMDCIGYNRDMQKMLEKHLGDTPIYLSNELLFQYIVDTYQK